MNPIKKLKCVLFAWSMQKEEHTVKINNFGGEGLKKYFFILPAMIIGGFMISVTSNNLGELGNMIMLNVGRVLISVAAIILLVDVFSGKKRKKYNG